VSIHDFLETLRFVDLLGLTKGYLAMCQRGGSSCLTADQASTGKVPECVHFSVLTKFCFVDLDE
jgi:hypothetical protein